MTKRPGAVSFIGWILVIQATFGLISGIVLIALRSTSDILELTKATESELLSAGVVAIVIGLITGLVGAGLLGGSRVARVVVAIIQVLHVASATWLMFTHHAGAFLWSGLISIGIAVFVLWALFNEKADAYFEAS